MLWHNGNTIQFLVAHLNVASNWSRRDIPEARPIWHLNSRYSPKLWQMHVESSVKTAEDSCARVWPTVCVCVTGEPSLRWSWPRRRGPRGWWPSSASPRRRWRARRTASRMRSQSCTSELIFEIISPLNIATDKIWCHGKWWDNKLFCRTCRKKPLHVCAAPACVWNPRQEVQECKFFITVSPLLHHGSCIILLDIICIWYPLMYDICCCNGICVICIISRIMSISHSFPIIRTMLCELIFIINRFSCVCSWGSVGEDIQRSSDWMSLIIKTFTIFIKQHDFLSQPMCLCRDLLELLQWLCTLACSVLQNCQKTEQ